VSFKSRSSPLNIKDADTDDLLDQVTAYRLGTEPAAIELIEKELRHRGIMAKHIAERREACEQAYIYLDDGVAAMCAFCRKPAIKQGWGWHRLFGIVPIIPRWLRYCSRHA